MRRFFWAMTISLALLPIITSAGLAAGESLPMIGGKEAVATVNGEPITSEEMNQALGIRHAEMQGDKKVGKVDYTEILDRLVNIKLILLEARNIGLDELPEIKEAVENYSRNALAQVLLDQQTKDIRVTDNEVNEKYKEMVKEFKLQSLLFGKEEDAKNFEAEIRSGQDFNKIAKKVLAEETAKGREEGAYVKPDNLLPEIKEAISRMEIGSISPVIRIKAGFTIVKLEEIRFPENPEAREQAKDILLGNKKFEKSREYLVSLRKEYVTVKREVLDGLDYEASAPGFQALFDDRRAVAEVKGEEPVTVGELSKAIEKKFFHGIEKAVEKKKINARKMEVLNTVLNKRVIRKEAIRLGVDKSEIFRNMVKEYENSVVFGAFLEKVIRPGIRLEEKELKAYYDKNIAEFSSPEMMRIDSLVFSLKARAKEAMHKLNEGADFSWVGANAEGQVDKNSAELLQFDGKLVAVNSLPKDVQDVVTGASPGDLRLYESPEGYFYLLSLRDVVPSKPQPFESVINEIAGKVGAEKMKREVEGYAVKLRKAYPVKVFLKAPRP